jgi:hypothetical protein
VDSKPPASDGRPGSDPTATKASADSRSLEQRLKAQEDLYASHVDIFSVASRDALEETRLAAGQLLGQARVQGGPEHRIEELRKLRQDFQQLLLRWDDARNVLLDLERSYLRCEERWRRRPQPAGLDTAERSSAVDREWEEDLELSLRLCEKRAAQLLRLGPEALLAERERLDALWKFTSRRQNTEAADSKSSTGAATSPLEALKAAVASDSAEPAAPDFTAGSRRSSGIRSRSPPSRKSVEPEGSSAANSAASESRSESPGAHQETIETPRAARGEAGAVESARSEEREDGGSADSRSDGGGIGNLALGALAGFAVGALGLLGLLSLQRSHKRY